MFCSCAKLRSALPNKHSVISCVRKLLRSDRQAFRSQATRSNAVILGIETSCDDTAIGVVDDQGNVLGESSHSQLETHNEYGGIIPPIARDLHQQHIDCVAERALKQCPVPAEEMSAIAVTVRPGMSLSLLVGLNFARRLAAKHGKPLIPIHHMEAHALAIRLVQRVDFPYLVLLVSGGHCQLAVVRDIDDFLLLGQTMDDAPGETFDKVARRLKLINLPECRGLSGGRALEFLAERDSGNPLAYRFPEPLTSYRTCNFSFSGLKNSVYRKIEALEKEHGLEADALLPEIADLCASTQHAVAYHLARRTQRALAFCDQQGLLPEGKPTLVVAGGVAANAYLGRLLSRLCEKLDVAYVPTPPKLCSDNGLMIAWNGVERWRTASGIVTENFDSLDITPRCPLGVDISLSVAEASIKLDKIKLSV